jgi:hypothetical protein
VLKRVILIALVAAPAALAAPEPAAVSIAAAPQVVTFGDSTELSGSVSPPRSVTISLASKTCAGAPRLVRSGPPLTLESTSEGTWRTTVTPLVRTTYVAGSGRAQAQPLTVDVRPRMTLSRIGKHRFHLHIAAAISFGGSIALFQKSTPFGWKTVQSVYLASFDSASDAITSGRTFRSGIARGQNVRMLLPQRQVGDCYASATSNTVRS